MEAASLHAPMPDLFDGDDRDQLPLFLYQVKSRLALEGMEKQLPENEKVFTSITYLRGRACKYFERCLGDFLSHKDGPSEEILMRYLAAFKCLRIGSSCSSDEAR
jgi:hypothetical protein